MAERLSRRDTDDLFAAGWTALQAERLEEAEELFLAVLSADPAHADALSGLGTAYFHQNRLKEAEHLFERAEEASRSGIGARVPERLNGDVPAERSLLRALHGRALVAYRAGRLEEAARGFERLIALNPEDRTGARFLLEDIRHGRKKWDQADPRAS